MEVDPLSWHLTPRSHMWRPPTDIYETDEAVTVRMEVAGMQDEDFSIELDGRYLVVRGTRSDILAVENTAQRRAYHQMEIRFGEFSAEIELPAPVVASQVEAVYENGFLKVVLPKARPVQIQVEE